MTGIATREYRGNAHHHPPGLRELALGRVARGERAIDVARDLELPAQTVYGWVSENRRAALGIPELPPVREDLDAAAARVQRLLDATGLSPEQKRPLQNAIIELVAEAMRRE